MIKRVVLFLATNLLIMLTISIVLNLLGVRPYLSANGIDYQSLLVYCFVWGMTGALISLGLSRIMAKWMMGVQVIAPGASGPQAQLVEMVYSLSRAAGLPKMPEVGVYNSPEVNAFATGPSKSRALVAFSTGLLESMSRQQIEAVAAHEISHIKNGDMVTMTLLQGVINAFVMFFARIIAFAVSRSVKEESQYMVQMLVTIVLEIVLGLLGAIGVAWFSRQREFRADAGAASLCGAGPMVSALEFLAGRSVGRSRREPESLAAFKINGRPGGFLSLFATHPPITERIAKLQRQ